MSTAPEIITGPLRSTLLPAALDVVIAPLRVIPSAPSSVIAPISSALPIAPIDIVSVAEALPELLTALMVTVSEESPLIAATVIAPPLLLMVRFDPLSKSIVPVAKVIAFPAVAALPPKLSTATAPPVKSIT